MTRQFQKINLKYFRPSTDSQTDNVLVDSKNEKEIYVQLL